MAGPTWPSFSPQSTHGLSPAALGSVWLSGCTWLPCRCSLTTLKPFVPIPDRGTSLCTNPIPHLASPPLTSLRSLGQWSQRHGLPGPFPFSSRAFPRRRRPTKQCFWTEAVYSGLGTTWMPCLSAPVKGGHQVCKVRAGDGWGLWASAAFLCCTLLPQLTSAL